MQEEARPTERQQEEPVQPGYPTRKRRQGPKLHEAQLAETDQVPAKRKRHRKDALAKQALLTNPHLD